MFVVTVVIAWLVITVHVLFRPVGGCLATMGQERHPDTQGRFLCDLSGESNNSTCYFLSIFRKLFIRKNTSCTMISTFWILLVFSEHALCMLCACCVERLDSFRFICCSRSAYIIYGFCHDVDDWLDPLIGHSNLCRIWTCELAPLLRHQTSGPYFGGVMVLTKVSFWRGFCSRGLSRVLKS